MAGKQVPQRLTGAEAREKIAAMGGTIMFEKVLTSSDVNGTGRLVIPKSQAEAHFPRLEEQTGINLALTDTEGKQHTFRYRFWVNNQSRMYLLEHTASVQANYRMQAGDVLVFAKLPEGLYGICGRKGTKDDVSRKPPQRRTGAQQPAGGAGGSKDGSPAGCGGGGGAAGTKRVRSRGGETLKSKRMKLKAASQEIQSMMSYWSGYSLPMRKDGVFRAVPNSAVQEGDKVLAQYGAWSAIVSLNGELFQAFFETHEAANAALEAALQSQGGGGSGSGGGGGKGGGAARPPPATRSTVPGATGAVAAAAAAAGGGSARSTPVPAGAEARAQEQQPAGTQQEQQQKEQRGEQEPQQGEQKQQEPAEPKQEQQQQQQQRRGPVAG